jgi:hypothetical protein
MQSGKKSLSETPRPRYSARVQTPKGVREIGFGADLTKELSRVRRHHEKHGFKVWVWDIRTGHTVPESQIEAAAGGAQ